MFIDPVTKKYLQKNIEPIFGFPNIVRFCWSTAETVLKDHAIQIDWYVFILIFLKTFLLLIISLF